ncbi:MAG: transglutaminase [Novosphingobium sp. 28-62-57]|uniref:transglutaminase-like domain-containing protein n=1 Tax=Novosphingobium sp. 28-62-57 TaxID=1970409 RepID=UPI000BC76D58|nr:transglutaminase family protein [Novosphingobium sp. 28-62-57]OYW48333.1 MAG: transglutaminase [Novosphingobium sp. 12-62-10]OYZ09600.1 MAG: transglutaminase [Novosphingobium sp. 28-62-57]OZA31564.1 MAG: transglutaminase [Novosphingobium sp. 17-62-9]
MAHDITVSVRLDYTMRERAPVLMQIEAASLPGQTVRNPRLVVSPDVPVRAIPAHDNVGERIWLEPEAGFTVAYDATVSVTRQASVLASLVADPLPSLPPSVVEYLLPSRYCPVDTLHVTAMDQFGGMSGGMMVSSVTEWIAGHLSYVPGASHGATTALDTFLSREGVCRDYAHLLIALVRGLGIPARMVSAYAPGVTPPDFHALAEVWLQGGWHLVDATGMADPAKTVVIGVGRDAADVAFLTIFGGAELNAQSVEVGLTNHD